MINLARAVERCERLAKLGSPPPWWRARKLRRWLAAYRAIMAFDISAAAEMLRALYPADAIEELANQQSSFCTVVTKPANGHAAIGRWVDPIEELANEPNNTLRSFTRSR